MLMLVISTTHVPSHKACYTGALNVSYTAAKPAVESFIFNGTLWPSWVATETVYKLKQSNVKMTSLWL